MSDAQMTDKGYSKSSCHRWALLIGVNTYIEPNFSPLRFCVNDVRALEQVFKELNYTVVCLHDEQKDLAKQPTRHNIEEELNRLCKTVQEDDLLFVHFACHGKLWEKQAVLIAHDTRYSLIAKQALFISEIEKYMRTSKAKQLVLSLDACHVGVDVGRDFSDPEFLHNVYDLATGFALIAASTSQQKAQEWREKQHGAYTYYLLEGLQGKADKSRKEVITVRDLQEYVTDNLRRWAVREGGLIQEPTIRIEGIGDMILADYRQMESFNSIEFFPTTNLELKSATRDIETLLSDSQSNQSYIQNLPTFNFEFVTVNAFGAVINKQKGQAKYFTENLEGTQLDMVFVPGGNFTMGSSELISKNESPPHEVFIQSFFLSKHQITQAQWKAVSLLPEVDCQLNSDPSYFKGENRPVDTITWYEANEFCQRLSKYTGHQYRLPTEAEWEYACRAGTTTQFHFGETLITELANYLDSRTYDKLERGKYISKTIPVMSFPPNAFGLYDMHGNAREWCSDHWHDSYFGAPTDGSAWVASGSDVFRILRGGSCLSKIEDCRSTSRYKDSAKSKNRNNSFRIVCLRERLN